MSNDGGHCRNTASGQDALIKRQLTALWNRFGWSPSSCRVVEFRKLAARLNHFNFATLGQATEASPVAIVFDHVVFAGANLVDVDL